MILFFAGNGFFLYSMYLLGNDFFLPVTPKEIISKQSLAILPDDAPANIGLVKSGLYGVVRHPMQLGLVLIICFGGNNYTIDRLIFMGVHIFWQVSGIIF